MTTSAGTDAGVHTHTAQLNDASIGQLASRLSEQAAEGAPLVAASLSVSPRERTPARCAA